MSLNSDTPHIPVASSKPATLCLQCGLRYQCICSHHPKLDSAVHIALLTHPNELNRATNTGKLLTQSLANCTVHIWDRVHPPAALLEQIKHQPTYVLFPSDDAFAVSSITIQDNQQSDAVEPLFIILDSTWQEAKKMLNKSPWLAALPKVMLHTSNDSHYSLRRNQTTGHLCTCEVGMALLQQREPQRDVTPLQQYFELFLAVYEEDRNHRVWQEKGKEFL
ncbi:tRNA-uridine aminocarboxypropyltransferase [Vibrio rumoiensis]|uniref:tRNA-uridine aminocarboxypropyltransferase n=1 Tax=Vibrio rumoiensis 1S-45 TaxID=1188252 RepID=A0A1E5E355_9VIBR|nr:DTW domain-containing protein [Vibrio rumoiensis]OEF26100.1 hypothetical protein A1QC_07455 [Vibrio rumoiensis 1S-45]